VRRIAAILVVFGLMAAPQRIFATLLNLGPEELVWAGGTEITVPGYSVPSYVDWNNDGLEDLVVGEGGGGGNPGYVRIYLNEGTASSPQFSGPSYAMSGGTELTYSSGCNCGCLGLFPRVVYWDGDDRKDLIVGTPDGTVILYRNIGTDTDPTFDGGTMLQFGPAEPKADISVGLRATPTVIDWNNDGMKDLAVGALDGRIHLFINEGTDVAPDFLIETFAKNEDGSDLVVPPLGPIFGRSSPVILDLDGDGCKDLLTGNTEGKLLFYKNVGSDSEPVFSGYVLVESAGVAIDLEGDPRSRPFVCDWTGDGYLDVLIGAGDGMVHLYQGVPEPATIALFGLGGLALVRKRRT
jgi:hypothetical protein